MNNCDLNKILFAFITVVIFAMSMIFPRNLEYSEAQVLSRSEQGAVIKSGPMYHKISYHSKNGKGIVIDTLFYFNVPQSPEDYDDWLASFQGIGEDPADTVINMFTLLGPGKITKLFIQNTTSGIAKCHIWAPTIDYDENEYIFPDEPGSEDILPEPVDLYCYPQDHNNQFDSLTWSPEWNVVDLENEFGSGIEVNVGSLDFWVGYSMNTTGNPKIWQDGVFHDTGAEGFCRSFTTLHSECPDVYGCWYAVTKPGDKTQWLAHMMQIEVQYSDSILWIEDVSRFSNTFDEKKSVIAKIGYFQDFDISVELFYKSGISGNYMSVSMISDTCGVYLADIYPEVGDTVYYYVKASNGLNFECLSSVYSFVRLNPPGDDISVLLINDGAEDNYLLYERAFNQLGVGYYYWDIEKNNGIEREVIQFPGFNAVVVFGLANRVVPITDYSVQDIYGIVEYLESGRNLILVDMDYLYGWNMPVEGSFEPGDFAYDYLGIGNYESDPATADSEMVGIADDPITDFFSGETSFGPIDYDSVDWGNYGDIIEPNFNAYSIFFGKSSRKSMAIRNRGDNFCTLTFSFPIELASDFSEFKTLLDSSLLWFSLYPTPIDNDIKVLDEFALFQNYPNPFNTQTKIRYEVCDKKMTSLDIYDVKGRFVKNLFKGSPNLGVYTSVWDGKNYEGIDMPSGVYFYRLSAEGKVVSKKMLLLR